MIIKEYHPHTTLTTRDELNFDPVQNATLSEYVAANPYGDWIGMAAGLKLLCEKFKDDNVIKVLEMGTAHGHFVWSMRNYIRDVMKKDTIAVGMDSMLHGYGPKFFAEPDMTFVKGMSTDPTVVSMLDNDFHFIFIDGCHCQNHAFMDAITFHLKLRKGGFLGFHDTHPKFQGGTEQPRTEECSEDTHIGVVKGINQFDMEKNGFSLLLEEAPLDKDFGGLRFYESVK